MAIPTVTFLQSPYQNARDARYALRAFVEHRIVGTLPSARRAFGLVAGDAGRRASSHFGLGFVNGVLTIDQYVPLDRMAWTNGDVRDPTWSRIIPGVNPNLYTVTFEHEDGGSAGRGVIAEAVWRATMELQALLTSGDAAAIRAKGIRGATDAIVAQMRAIPKDATGFIDHHAIAGPNKPYCLRRWLDDPGLIEGSPSRRDRLLAAVRGGAVGGDAMPRLHFQAVEWKTDADAPFWREGPGAGAMERFVGVQTVDSIARTTDDNGAWVLVRIPVAGQSSYVWMKRTDLTPAAEWEKYEAAVRKVIEIGPAALSSGGISEAEVAKRTAAAAKAAAADVKKAANADVDAAAAKYGA